VFRRKVYTQVYKLIIQYSVFYGCSAVVVWNEVSQLVPIVNNLWSCRMSPAVHSNSSILYPKFFPHIFYKGCVFSLLHQINFNLSEIGWLNIIIMWDLFLCPLDWVECKDSCWFMFNFIHEVTAIQFIYRYVYVYQWNKLYKL
jgi:hypothetical protein